MLVDINKTQGLCPSGGWSHAHTLFPVPPPASSRSVTPQWRVLLLLRPWHTNQIITRRTDSGHSTHQTDSSDCPTTDNLVGVSGPLDYRLRAFTTFLAFIECRLVQVFIVCVSSRVINTLKGFRLRLSLSLSSHSLECIKPLCNSTLNIWMKAWECDMQ